MRAGYVSLELEIPRVKHNFRAGLKIRDLFAN